MPRIYSMIYHRATFLIALGFLLAACTPTPEAPIPETIVEKTPIPPQVTKTLPPPTETPEPVRTLLPVDATYQIVQNSSFNADKRNWSQRSGKLNRTTSQYYTAPGAGMLITSEAGNLGVAGQCIDLQEKIMEWPNTDIGKEITFATYLKTDENIEEANLLIIFHQGDCKHEDQLHVQVGTLNTTPLIGAQDWTLLSTSGIIPDDTKSVDVIIRGSGVNNEGKIYFDDVRTYLPAP
ncbi:MAG: hypothetical protein HN855_05560 [Anaerolineae bacterium]|jgi:hypothetical protein|nr:hypothetical protein [Anaerolineae bacterium]MBT7072568.1 hypothetical protein [Anaerolineae bacterium]MBT7324606.1 hypothetical protein [Anaerolineae bacterium]